MPFIEYSLFRVKMVRPHQKSFLHDDLPARDIFLRAVLEKPSGELRKGFEWHIGNIRQFTGHTGYFAVGRTTRSTIGKFNSDSGDFVEEELEESPYTHCVFDTSIGIIGIAKKPNLAQTTQGIADRIKQLLSITKSITKNNIVVEIRPIPDPEGFLSSLDSAFRVFTFSATFRGPNPFDADEHFQRPLSVYLSAAEGQKGRTTISGDDLNRAVLREVTRSTAATGNEASARIQKSIRQKPMTINLRGDPIKRKYDEEEHRPEVALDDLTIQYDRVRRSEKN